MTDKAEEKAAKDKAAVLAMKNAQAHMQAALSRISALECQLKQAKSVIARLKSYIGESVYEYRSEKRCRTVADEAMAEIEKLLSE